MALASSHTSPLSALTTPVTSSTRPVSTLACGSRSKPRPLGRRPLTHMEALADRSTKSHFPEVGALGRSP